MDILSRLFDEMHLQSVQYISIYTSGAWRLEQPQQEYLTFIVMVKGAVFLHYANSVQSITANNMMMLTSQGGYVCQSAASLVQPYSSFSLPTHEEGQIDLMAQDGVTATTAETHFIIVRSQFDAHMARPLLSALPTSLPTPSQKHSAYNDVVSIGLQFFQLEVGLQRPGKTTMLARLAGMLMIECIRKYVEQLDTASVLIADVKYDKDAWVDTPWQIATNHDEAFKPDLDPAINLKAKKSDNDSKPLGSTEHGSGNWLAALKDPYLSKTLYLMHRYPEEAWTIQRLAAESGLSRSGLNERFKALIGITPQAYLSHYRLRLAARFLRQEQYSISKISALVGYASDNSFNGAFKRRYGQSPSHYRKAFIQAAVS